MKTQKLTNNLIPLKWTFERIESIGETISGGTPKTGVKEYWGGDIKWITPTDVTSLKGYKYINDTNRTITNEGLKNSSANLLPVNSLIVCTRATIGDCVINEVELSTNQGFKSLVPYEGFDTNYLYYSILNIKPLLIQLSSGSTFLELSTKAFKNIGLLIPPLPEQQKIAEILSTVDEKIEAIDQRIAETQALKKGLMQQLLTKGIGHTKFKDSPLGEIPESWEVVELGQLSSIKGRIGYRGYTKADLVAEGEGALTIGAKHIDKNSQLNFSEPVFINWEKYEESPEIKVSLGDLLMVQRGTLGKIALVKKLPFPATINPSMVLIKELKCNASYLFYYLCSNNIQDIIYQISTATAVPMISQKQINSFKVGLPDLDEQQKIAEILNSVDEKLQIQQDKKTEYQELKKGLMQQLLTGKIRVKT